MKNNYNDFLANNTVYEKRETLIKLRYRSNSMSRRNDINED